jgi:hypothetical protein
MLVKINSLSTIYHLKISSLVLFVVACACPATRMGGEHLPGITLMVLGWMNFAHDNLLFVGWLANIFLLIAILIPKNYGWVKVFAAVIPVLFALIGILCLIQKSPLLIGGYLWFLSMVLYFASTILIPPRMPED